MIVWSVLKIHGNPYETYSPIYLKLLKILINLRHLGLSSRCKYVQPAAEKKDLLAYRVGPIYSYLGGDFDF